MPVAVLFSGPFEPSSHAEIRAALVRVECAPHEHWEAVFSIGDSGSDWTMAINGPDYHRHVFRIAGGDDERQKPEYLAEILRAEISLFPSCPPRDFVLAVAELARQQVRVSLGDAFRGYVTVEGVRVLNDRLVDLYRRDQLTSQALRARFG